MLYPLEITKRGGMIKWDGHTHSEFCRHGSGEKTAHMVERAIQLGFDCYSITEHAPLPPGIIDNPELAADFTLLPHELADYFSLISDLKKVYGRKINILSGLEVDYIIGYQDYFDDFTQENLPFLDDLIVSLHMIEGKNGIVPIDYSPEVFETELVTFHGSAEEVHRAYWSDIKELIRHPVNRKLTKRIGHLGLINKYKKRFPVDLGSSFYQELLPDVFKEIRHFNWDLDYNVAGLKKDLCHDIYISDQMRAYCRLYQIKLVYGSDAHDVNSVGQFYDQYLDRVENRTDKNDDCQLAGN